MEALSPGTFQANIDSMFKLNGIPMLKFPTNIVTESIKEILRDTKNATQETTTKQTGEKSQTQKQNLGKDKEKETGKEEITVEYMNTESNKRARESSDFSEAVEKRKRELEQKHKKESVRQQNTDLSLPQPLTTRSRPLSPGPAPGAVGTGERAPQPQRVKTKPKEQTDSTQTKPKINVKDIGIYVYFKKSTRYVLDLENPERREIIRDAIVTGEARIQWRHTQVAYQSIFNGILNRFIKIEEISVTKIPDRDFEKLKNKCINT